MEPETAVTLLDYTEPTTDTGGGRYGQYVGFSAPDHDPFADYPPGSVFHDGAAGVYPASIVAGVTPTLAHNLDVRRSRVWGCWGTGVQVGWIGDASHQAECSDHNPDVKGVVHAIDVMVTGDRAAAVVRECLLHSGDLQYVIHNRVIWSASTSWQPRAYTGSNPHTDHVHVSGKHGTSNGNSSTCTGYDLAAQASNPAFNPCAAPPPLGHAPGSRQLDLETPHLTGADVVFVQKFIGPAKAGAADGDFGPNTRDGVLWYQRMRGITADGVVGPNTWAQMGVRWTG